MVCAYVPTPVRMSPLCCLTKQILTGSAPARTSHAQRGRVNLQGPWTTPGGRCGRRGRHRLRTRDLDARGLAPSRRLSPGEDRRDDLWPRRPARRRRRGRGSQVPPWTKEIRGGAWREQVAGEDRVDMLLKPRPLADELHAPRYSS